MSTENRIVFIHRRVASLVDPVIAGVEKGEHFVANDTGQFYLKHPVTGEIIHVGEQPTYVSSATTYADNTNAYTASFSNISLTYFVRLVTKVRLVIPKTNVKVSPKIVIGTKEYALLEQNGTEIPPGRLTKGALVDLIYDGDNFRLMGIGSSDFNGSFIDWGAKTLRVDTLMVNKDATGTTAAKTDNSKKFATTEFVQIHAADLKSEINKKADIESPSLTGKPTAPTPVAGDNSTIIATTGFVHDSVEKLGDRSVAKTTTVTAGKGLVGGGTLATSITLNIGTPESITGLSTNSTSEDGHSHAIDKASVNQPGIVKLNDTLESVSTTEALAAAQGKVLNDKKADLASPTFTGNPTAPNPASNDNTTRLATTAFVHSVISAIQATLASNLVSKQTSLSAGDGLTGGGDLSTNRTLSLGSPGTISGSSTNSVSPGSHTHEIAKASTSDAGIVKLNDTLTSTSTSEALTANQGRMLNVSLNAKADLNSATLTGVPSAPTPLSSDKSTRIATTAFVDNLITSRLANAQLAGSGDVSEIQKLLATKADKADVDLKAPINSPNLTGTPTAPTPAPTSNGTQIATTQFVVNGLSTKADAATTITAGKGLTGGGNLSAGRTITLGTPGKITASSTSSATAESHTHEIDKASLTQAGVVQLNNTLTSSNTDQALTAAQGKALKDALDLKAAGNINLTAGNGLTGGGNLGADRTITLGTPTKITSTSTNTVTGTSHTHEIDNASTSTAGVVQLNNTLTSTSQVQALTAAQGKVLNDTKLGNSGNQKIDNGWLELGNSSAHAVLLRNTPAGQWQWNLFNTADIETSGSVRASFLFANTNGSKIVSVNFPDISGGNETVAYQSWVSNTWAKTGVPITRPIIAGGGVVITLNVSDKSSIIAALGDNYRQYGINCLALYNNTTSNITGLPISNKVPIELRFHLMGGHSWFECFYPTINRTFISNSVNWNVNSLNVTWREILTDANGVTIDGAQDINGRKNFKGGLTTNDYLVFFSGTKGNVGNAASNLYLYKDDIDLNNTLTGETGVGGVTWGAWTSASNGYTRSGSVSSGFEVGGDGFVSVGAMTKANGWSAARMTLRASDGTINMGTWNPFGTRGRLQVSGHIQTTGSFVASHQAWPKLELYSNRGTQSLLIESGGIAGSHSFTIRNYADGSSDNSASVNVSYFTLPSYTGSHTLATTTDVNNLALTYLGKPSNLNTIPLTSPGGVFIGHTTDSGTPSGVQGNPSIPNLGVADIIGLHIAQAGVGGLQVASISRDTLHFRAADNSQVNDWGDWIELVDSTNFGTYAKNHTDVKTMRQVRTAPSAANTFAGVPNLAPRLQALGLNVATNQYLTTGYLVTEPSGLITQYIYMHFIRPIWWNIGTATVVPAGMSETAAALPRSTSSTLSLDNSTVRSIPVDLFTAFPNAVLGVQVATTRSSVLIDGTATSAAGRTEWSTQFSQEAGEWSCTWNRWESARLNNGVQSKSRVYIDAWRYIGLADEGMDLIVKVEGY